MDSIQERFNKKWDRLRERYDGTDRQIALMTFAINQFFPDGAIPAGDFVGMWANVDGETICIHYKTLDNSQIYRFGFWPDGTPTMQMLHPRLGGAPFEDVDDPFILGPMVNA